MNSANVILIIIIIVLTFILVTKGNLLSFTRKNKNNKIDNASKEKYAAWNVTNPNKEVIKKDLKYEDIANKALKENQEFFAVCQDSGNTQKFLDSVCGANEPDTFAKWDYGAPGLSYSDYVASQAVDNKVIENHLMFVRDRRGLGPDGEFITGRTYSPDSHDSYDPIPWIGIRGRPQYVEQCNPTQVPDVDTNLYKSNRPFCFWT